MGFIGSVRLVGLAAIILCTATLGNVKRSIVTRSLVYFNILLII